MNSPKISVVLPTYNRSSTLERAIRSVLSQTLKNIELIVVDDGSTDSTAQVVGSFDDPRLIYLRQKVRRGAAAARNAGIARSRATWIAFQDSDDEWLLDKLYKQISAVDQLNESVGLVCCGYIVMARSGKVHYEKGNLDMLAGHWGPDNICDFSFITPTWLVRRDVLQGAGLFDESLSNLEDWELSFRLFRITGIKVLKEPLVIKYGSSDSINPEKQSRVQSLEFILKRHSSIWSDYPKVKARLYFKLGSLQCLMGDMKNGRSNLRKALRFHTTSTKYWFKLCASLFGSSIYRKLVRLAR